MVSHTFGCIRWNVEVLVRKTRINITHTSSLHSNESVDRLHLRRIQCGRRYACKQGHRYSKLVRKHEKFDRGNFLYGAAPKLNIQLMRLRTTRSKDPLQLREPHIQREMVKMVVQERHLQDHISKQVYSMFCKNIDELQLPKKLTFAFLTSPQKLVRD